MPIPESQLETWSHHSQTDTAIRAHEDIRAAVKALGMSPVALANFSDYLQGSYRNYTNTVRDHDVDIVLQLNTCYTFDASLLSRPDATVVQSLDLPATYTLAMFRSGVLTALRNAFGWSSVRDGHKSITVSGASGVRLDADVIVCQQHRLYYSVYPYPQYHEGISFYHGVSGRLIVNYPKQHYDNGVMKQDATGGWFKPTVRILKNARSYMVDHGLLAANVAPSYFIQGLLYNVPSEVFGGSFRHTFDSILSWLLGHYEELPSFLSQNGLVPLIGLSDEQWTEGNALRFILALIELDRDWT